MPVSGVDTRDGIACIDGTRVTVVEVYREYTKRGKDAAIVAHEFEVGLDEVHEALAYYYRNAKELIEMRSERGLF